MKKILLIGALALSTMSCGDLNQILTTTSGVLNSLSLSEGDAANGLKQALEFGVLNGTSLLGKQDGFLKNTAYQILMPEEVRKVEAQIRNNAVTNALAGPFLDKVKIAMNRGAEQAMAEAKPIFVNAIRSMTISDALNIVTGKPGSATDFLRKATETQLMSKFLPVITNSLKAVNISEPWSKVSSAYNIAAGKKVTTDINKYVAGKAMDALFMKIRQEENDIRSNPAKRTTDLLKRVFAYADANKTK